MLYEDIDELTESISSELKKNLVAKYHVIFEISGNYGKHDGAITQKRQQKNSILKYTAKHRRKKGKRKR